MIITLSQIHYHMDHSNMFSCLTLSSHSTMSNLVLLSCYSFTYHSCPRPVPLHNGFRIIRCHPCGKHLYMKFFLPLVLKTHSFLKLLRLATFSTNLFSAFISFVCNTVTFFYHGIFHPVIPQTLNCCISIYIH